MVEQPIDTEYPKGLLPKRETAVTTFLSKYPEYDGRNTIIGIFDSGVDPGAPGLQKTSDGKVKVIHRFDCSGCGDVNTTTIVRPVDNVITGLTGRKLKIPSSWKNPSNNYRIGVKRAYLLFPERLEESMSETYKEKKWDKNHRKSVAAIMKQIAEFDAKHTTTTLSEADKLAKEDLDAKLEILNNAGKKFNDAGPVYDCILFHDGDKWQCCVDTTEKGDLDQCTVIGEYSLTHEYATLTPDDNLNYSMNVHDNGNVLELVGLCSSHGTHVASIAAAYFPDCPEECGVAPGAQIASFTIGDGRLGSMETGTAIIRAIIKLMELLKHEVINVINMSYGEHAHFSDVGRVGDLMNEVVNKYGVVWVASAGNHGPALSTIGAPPDISQETIIGVGAYVSPDMMVSAYSMRQKLPGMAFTWSSRGPCMDGAIGVTVCAPGCAVTSVPNCTLRYSQLMNGTSMAAPHVAGAISLLISGILKKELTYSPYSIKRAIQNTASYLDNVEVFAQGSGLLQVDKAFEHLVEYNSAQERDVRFHLTTGSSNAKGVYIRAKSSSSSTSHAITVEPHFLDSDNVEANVKIDFNMKLALICSASYVSCPTHLTLANGSRVFGIKIEPTQSLPIGVHSTFIEAYDVDCVKKGPIFKFPITIINPQEVTTLKHSLTFSNVLFKPNTIQRHFVVVPNFATWAVLKLTTNDINGCGRFVIHTMHIIPKKNCKSLELTKAISIVPNAETVLSFQVQSNAVLEIVIAKYWANLGDVTIDYSINFNGVKSNQQSITMHGADGVHCVEVNTLQCEEISPSITLKTSVQVLKPSEGKVLPLTSRDVVPQNRQIFELVLVYNFTLTKSAEVSPNLSMLSDVLYESEFESQLWLLFDSNKQLLKCGDAYPSKYSAKLEKGDYVIRVQIRHEKKEHLDKLTEIPMLLQQKLSSAINLDVYSSYSQAVISGKKATVLHGLHNPVPFYIAPLASDKFVSKSNNPAQFLSGYITYCKDELGKKVDTHPFKYILYIPDAKKSSTSTNDANANADKSKYDENKEAIRDFKTSLVSKSASDGAVAEKMYNEFLLDYPDHLPLHTAYLQAIDQLDSKKSFPNLNSKLTTINKELISKIISICDVVIENVNDESILAYSAIKNDLRADAAKIKMVMDQQKGMLIECLCRKGIALCKMYLVEEKADQLEEVNGIWRSLAKFIDVTDSKVSNSCVVYFVLWHARVYKQYGRVLKYTLRLNEEKPSKDLEEKIIELCKLNEWDHMANHLLRNLPTKYPTGYASF